MYVVSTCPIDDGAVAPARRKWTGIYAPDLTGAGSALAILRLSTKRGDAGRDGYTPVNAGTANTPCNVSIFSANNCSPA
jgi:hypothetical protein